MMIRCDQCNEKGEVTEWLVKRVGMIRNVLVIEYRCRKCGVVYGEQELK